MTLTDLQEGLLYLIVFGPGYGESILLRAPPADWVVIDGCRARDVSLAANLLREHGASWKCIILSHPHLDHSLGLDEVIDLPGNGPIGCVLEGLASDAWVTSSDPEEQLRQGTREHVLSAISTRWRENPECRWPLRQGAARTVGDLKLTPLWPDDEAATASQALQDFNALSTPLLAEWRNVRLLLGADLPAGQWRHVGSQFDDLGEHSALKAPHHGSRASVSPVYGVGTSAGGRFWILTPWNKGRKLPQFSDGEGADELLRFVDELHLTGLPGEYDLQDQIPFRATRQELRDRARPAAVEHRLGPGLVMQVRPRQTTERLSHFVAAGFTPDGVLEDARFGQGSIVVSR